MSAMQTGAAGARRQEAVGSLLHGAGLLLSIAGLVVLVVLAARTHDAFKITGASVYGATLVLLYASSTLYHSRRPGGRARRVFRLLDHSSIYLLIAGTYTPFALVTLRGPWGWSLLGVIWALAALGIVYSALYIGRHPLRSALIYIAMGWLCMIALPILLARLPMAGFLWLLGGGVAYTLGTVFYVLDERVPYAHAVWHVFVLAGSAAHFVSVMLYVIPA